MEAGKEFLTRRVSCFILLGLIFLSCFLHINFFLQDGRPFLDHEWYYFSAGYNGVIVFVYQLLIDFLSLLLSDKNLNFTFLYQSVNVLYLAGLLIFIYLGTAFLYGRGFGLFATFFILTSPEIFNIFHKIEVNFQTAFFLSILLYFYIRCSFGRNRLFSFLVIGCGYLFFIQHYSSLLYLTPMFFIFFVVPLINVKRNCNAKRNIFHSGLLFCFLLVFDVSIRPMRYYLYSGEFIKYFNMYFFVDGKFFVNDIIGFADVFKSNLFMLYNSKLKYVDFYFIVSVLFAFLHLITCVKIICRKENLSFSAQINLILLAILLFCVFLLGTGICLVPVFFAPLYVFLALLNAGGLFKLYLLAKNHLAAKLFFHLSYFLVLVYGVCFIIFPNALIGGIDEEYDRYVPLNDDFNMQEHIEFFKTNGVISSNISVYPANVLLRNFAGLYAFSLSMGIDGRTSERDPSSVEYILGVYALKTDEHVKVFALPEIESDIFDVLVNKSGKKNISLGGIVPYGAKTEDRIIYSRLSEVVGGHTLLGVEGGDDFVTDRRSLVFFYLVEK